MDISEEAAFPVDYYDAPTVNIGDRCLRSHQHIRELISCLGRLGLRAPASAGGQSGTTL